jgi:hypothetical protein
MDQEEQKIDKTEGKLRMLEWMAIMSLFIGVFTGNDMIFNVSLAYLATLKLISYTMYSRGTDLLFTAIYSLFLIANVGIIKL